MNRGLIAAGLLLATAGTAAAPPGMTQLHSDALPGQPQRFSFEAGSGLVLDGGAPVAVDRDDVFLSHVPPSSGWIVELPAIVTVEGTQRVRVTCTVTQVSVSLGGPFEGGLAGSAGMVGATEHTFETSGPFFGRIILGVPRVAATSTNAEYVQCNFVVFGTRNGTDWRAFEFAPTSSPLFKAGEASAQYVFEADNSRLLSGVSFRRQVVLSAAGYLLTGK